jgi:hypothetical protein
MTIIILHATLHCAETCERMGARPPTTMYEPWICEEGTNWFAYVFVFGPGTLWLIYCFFYVPWMDRRYRRRVEKRVQALSQ